METVRVHKAFFLCLQHCFSILSLYNVSVVLKRWKKSQSSETSLPCSLHCSALTPWPRQPTHCPNTGPPSISVSFCDDLSSSVMKVCKSTRVMPLNTWRRQPENPWHEKTNSTFATLRGKLYKCNISFAQMRFKKSNTTFSMEVNYRTVIKPQQSSRTVLVWSQTNDTGGLISEPFMKRTPLLESLRRELWLGTVKMMLTPWA